mmetsp:Transcript_43833/g.89542  ORF Transcript_43833/g.89542 Transcript_43833/m.89542 type:complete len:270 (-) Transcript_43833:990-1799(-)
MLQRGSRAPVCWGPAPVRAGVRAGAQAQELLRPLHVHPRPRRPLHHPLQPPAPLQHHPIPHPAPRAPQGLPGQAAGESCAQGDPRLAQSAHDLCDVVAMDAEARAGPRRHYDQDVRRSPQRALGARLQLLAETRVFLARPCGAVPLQRLCADVLRGVLHLLPHQRRRLRPRGALRGGHQLQRDWNRVLLPGVNSNGSGAGAYRGPGGLHQRFLEPDRRWGRDYLLERLCRPRPLLPRPLRLAGGRAAGSGGFGGEHVHHHGDSEGSGGV